MSGSLREPLLSFAARNSAGTSPTSSGSLREPLLSFAARTLYLGSLRETRPGGPGPPAASLEAVGDAGAGSGNRTRVISLEG